MVSGGDKPAAVAGGVAEVSWLPILVGGPVIGGGGGAWWRLRREWWRREGGRKKRASFTRPRKGRAYLGGLEGFFGRSKIYPPLFGLVLQLGAA